MPPKSTKQPRARSGAPDASPFLLEKQIDQDEMWGWIVSTVIGLIVLATFWLVIPSQPIRIPSLAVLLVVSVAAGGFYFGVRFLAFWVTWVTQARGRRPSGRMQPGAHGELPRKSFMLVISAPGVVSALTLGTLWLYGLAPAAEFGLAVSVVAGMSVQDVRALFHLLPLDSACWVRQTSRGLDVLKLIERT